MTLDDEPSNTSNNKSHERPLNKLLAEREIIIAKVTRFVEFVKNSDENNLSELEIRLEHAPNMFKQFDSVQGEIESLDQNAHLTDDRETFESSYYKGVATARNVIMQLHSNINQRVQLNNQQYQKVESHNSFGKVSLPPIDLPKFDGDYKKWLFFIQRFNALINENSQLAKVEKFYYLQGRLQGEALEVIQDLELTDENYSIALNLLTDRYENKKVIIDRHIEELFSISEVTNESSVQLRKLIDSFKQHIRSLKALGEPTDSWDRLLIHLIKVKLDKTTRNRWQEVSHSQTNKIPPTLAEILDFLVCRCEYLESLDKPKPSQKFSQQNQNNFNHKTFIKQSQKPVTSYTNNNHTFSSIQRDTSTHTPGNCFYCNQSHGIYNCTTFMQLSPADRYKEVKKLGLCTNCLRKGHSKLQCNSSNCRLCRAKHNTLLHSNSHQDHQEPLSSSITKPSNCHSSTNTSHEQSLAHNSSATLTSISAHSFNEHDLVLLSTAIILIKDSYGNLHKARALLDVGSQSHYITESLAKKLHLQNYDINISVCGVGQSSIGISKQTNTLIQSTSSDFKIELSFLILPRITDKIPTTHYSLNQLNIPQNIVLADPKVNEPNEIDILLGASIFYELLINNQISLGKGKPLLQSSKLGWILAGVINCPIAPKPHKTLCSLSLNQQLTKFWELEEIPTKKHLSFEEEFCESFFKETTTRDNDGKFIVKFPFNESINQLGNSKPSALNRLQSIEKRFQRDPEYKKLYVQFINEYLTLNHMSLITSDITDYSTSFYLPHHGVKKESSTTKLRVVYDGSAVTDSGISLNHCLSVGPQIQDNLFDIIIRFRTHAYILTADIEKMYRMIVIHKEHRSYQRIFWREEKTQPIQTFEMSRLAYGLSSAPYLATRCLHELALHNLAEYPTSCHAILHDFYVDDLITGTDSLEEAKTLKQEITSILHSGGFTLRKWSSNNNEIIAEPSLEYQPFYEKSETKTLGLVWDPKADLLQYSVSFQSDNINVTKRQILATISKIFDPLGLIGPTTIKAKIVMQKLWQCQAKWDDPVPQNILSTWNGIIENIQSINNLTIPRHVLINSPTTIEIHGFCDASEAAYGCCLYLRSSNSTNVVVQLLCAKSKVAPLKRITLPRLELCGAITLARLLKTIKSTISKPIDNIFLYTDSKIVLAWLSTQPCYLQTFVANRVAEIIDITSISSWNHVKSSDNPADIISRGANPDQLLSNTLWWNGPEFLQNSNIQSSSFNTDFTDIDIPDMKLNSKTLTNQLVTDSSLFNKFSSLRKLIRVTAYILRFKNNCSSKHKQLGLLSKGELKLAELYLIKLAQSHEFASDISLLATNNSLPKSSKLLNLHPFLDENYVLRVGGRIQGSTVHFDQKHPIILPTKHRFTELLIQQEHKNHLHAGVQLLLANIRLRFWPISGKIAIKRVLRKCIKCFRVNPRPLTQLLGNLPADRFSTVRPFFKTAVDYAGPIFTKTSYLRNAKVVKSYICVFVCLSTKAVHLELVHNLSTEAFTNAMKRFISRRGKPSDIHSDNGLNFVGFNNELKDLYNLLSDQNHLTKFHNFLTPNNINWHFIPANSPHMGGLWEAAVKAVKSHLKRVIADTQLTFDEMYTLLVQIEACLNSRPLTPISDDPLDLSPLTPAHFLIGDSLAALPENDVVEVPHNRLNRFKRLQQIHQHFWRRWSKEYLGQLQVRTKWKSSQANLIKPGTLVVLKEDNLPPLKWCMGRIIQLFPGSDGLTRVVSVKTSSGSVLRRSISKVCPLPTC